MRMRQSLSELERAFFEEAEADRLRRERLYRQAAQRSSKRRIQRTHKAGSMRFVVLVLVLLGTAALVTAAMFRALYIVMGCGAGPRGPAPPYFEPPRRCSAASTSVRTPEAARSRPRSCWISR